MRSYQVGLLVEVVLRHVDGAIGKAVPTPRNSTNSDSGRVSRCRNGLARSIPRCCALARAGAGPGAPLGGVYL